MRDTIGKLLLWASGAIFLGIAAVIAAMIAGNEMAIWIGGHGLLFLGIPLCSVALTCAIIGFALRRTPRQREPRQPGSGLPLHKIMGWLAIGFAVVMLALLIQKVALLHSIAGDQIGMFSMIAFFDLKLPIACAALIFGIRMRHRFA